MAEISQETWDKFTEKEKQKIRTDYNDFVEGNDLAFIGRYKNLFGEENLQPEPIAEKCVEPIKEYFDMKTQDIEWNKCTKEEQQNILEIYNNHPEWLDVINALENKFGKHNLQPNKIRTWEDVEKENTICREDISALENLCYCEYKVIKKLIAIYKIAKLIELGYGGMVTEEEWKERKKSKYVIKRTTDKEPYLFFDTECDAFRFIAFHTPKQREEFMSYPENANLVEQYYMI